MDLLDDNGANVNFVGSPNCSVMERVILKLCSAVSSEQMPLKYVFSVDAYKSVQPKKLHNASIRRCFNRVYGALIGLGNQLKEDEVIHNFEVDVDGDSIVRMRIKRGDSEEINFGIVVGPYDEESGIIYLKKFGKDMNDFSIENMVAERISTIYSEHRIKSPERLSEFYVVTRFFDVDIETLSKNAVVSYVMRYRTVPLDEEEAKAYEQHYENNVNCSYPFASAIKRADKFVSFAKDDNKNIWLCTEEVFKRKTDSESEASNMFLGAVSMMGGDSQSDKEVCLTGLSEGATTASIIEHVVVEACAYGSFGMSNIKYKYALVQSTPEYEQMIHNKREWTLNLRDYFSGVTGPLNEAGNSLMKDGVIQSYAVGADGLMDVSIKMKREANGKEFGVNIGCYDSELSIISINAYGHELYEFSVEKMLADRIAVIYSEDRIEHPEYLRDFYMLTNCFNVNVTELRQHLKSSHDVDLKQQIIGTDIMQSYAAAYREATEHYNESINMFANAIKRVHDFVTYIRQDGDYEWECTLKEFSYM